MANCLEEQVLAAYASGRVPLEEARRIRAHLDTCADCRLIVDVIGATSRQRPAESWTLRPGERVGPYDVQEWLGRGGMGSVFAAYDARLQRKVALKILDANEVNDADRGEALERLRREAQAMARLNHPNVAAVYDIGERDGLPYFAMELLPGGTLRGWLQAQRRSALDIVRVFAAAARGLQHAHDAGLVHRDFKSDNVLMAQDGTPRLTDFGLASLDGVEDVEAKPNTGVICVAGTPAYFAPELLRGARATPQSDQYAFGIALRDAVRNLAEGREAVRLQRVVNKLTATEPNARYASMAAVAEALEEAVPKRRSWKRTTLAIAGASVAAIALGVAVWSRPPACDDAGLPARTLALALPARLQKSLATLDRPSQGALSAAVLRELNSQLQRAAALAETTCRAQSSDVAAKQARERCLTERLGETEAFIASLEKRAPHSGAAVVRRVLELPPPDICANLTAGETAAWTATEQAKLHAILDATEDKPSLDALKAVTSLLENTSDKTHPLLFARALALRVELEWSDPYQCATSTLEQLGHIARLAQTAHHQGLAALTWNELSRCHRARGELQQGYLAAKFSQELSEALPEDAFLRHYAALIRVRRLLAVDHAAESRALFLEVQKNLRERFGERHPLYAMSLLREADYLMNVADHRAALQVYPRAVSELEALLGKTSTERRAAAHNYAWALTQAFRYEEALPLFEQLAKESLEREGTIRRSISSDLVPVLVALGRKDEALFHGRASLQGVAPRELRVIASMGQEVNAWAEAELSFGNAAAVVERLSALRALEGLGDGGGVDDVDRRVLEARALLVLNRPKEALELLKDAAARNETKTNKRPRTIQALAAAQIKAHVAMGQLTEARTHLDKLPLNQDQGIDPLRRADAWVDLALALQKTNRAEAQTLAEALNPYLASLGDRAAAQKDRAKSLKKHPAELADRSR